MELTLIVPFPPEEEYTNSGVVCDDPKLTNQNEEFSRIRVNTVFNQPIKSNHKSGNQDDPSVQTDNQEIDPPDGGWGWVVCFAHFIESLIFDGMFYTFGIIFLDLTDYFRSNKGVGAFIPSLAFGMCFVSGMFVAPLCHRFGYRIVMVLGSVTACFGLVLSSFATSIWFLYVSYGIIAGLGYGMVYLPSALAVTVYFKKNRTFACGLALCGNGLGVFIMSPFTEWLLQHYTWKGTFLVHAGLCLNGIACGLVYRPVTTNANNNNRHDDMPKPISSVSTNVGTSIHICPNGNVPNDTGLTTNILKKRAEKSAKNYFNCTDNAGRMNAMEYDNPTMMTIKETNVQKTTAMTANDYLNNPTTVVQCKTDELLSALELNGKATRKSKSFFAEILDMSILKDSKFRLYVISSFLFQFCLYIPFVYLPDLSHHKGIDAYNSAWIMSSIGLASIVSRLFVGKLTDHPNANRIIVFGVTLIVSGLDCIMLPLLDRFEAVLCLAIIYGLCHGITNMLITVLIADLVGTQNLYRGVAARNVFSGVSTFLGPPFVGWLYDITQSYGAPFYVCGSVTVVSGLIVCAIPFIDHVHQTTGKQISSSIRSS